MTHKNRKQKNTTTHTTTYGYNGTPNYRLWEVDYWRQTTHLPSTFLSSSATGFRENLSTALPSGRPRWLIKITALAPLSSACLIVGNAATILSQHSHGCKMGFKNLGFRVFFTKTKTSSHSSPNFRGFYCFLKKNIKNSSGRQFNRPQFAGLLRFGQC